MTHPFHLVAYPRSGEIRISWNDAGVMALVERRPVGWLEFTRLGYARREWTDTDVVLGMPYEYRLSDPVRGVSLTLAAHSDDV